MSAILTNMPYAEYDALPGMRGSDLVYMAPTPAHFRAHMAAPRVVKPEYVIGRAVHTLVLEPHLFAEGYLVLDGDAPKRPTEYQRNGKKPSAATEAAFEFWAAIEAGEDRGKEILTAEDFELCRRMADSIATNKGCQRYLAGEGYNEVVVTWTDPETGVACKQRNDRLGSLDGGGLGLFDIKTAASAECGAFAWAAGRFRYFTKAGFSMYGLDVIGHRPDAYALIVVEKAEPYLSVVYPLSAEAIAQGEADARALLREYARCEASGEWPGYEEQELAHPRPSRRKEFYPYF